MRKIYLTENQVKTILSEGFLRNIISKGDTNSLVQLVKRGMISAAIAIAALTMFHSLTPAEVSQVKTEIAEVAPIEQWKMIADDVIVTVYNAVPGQCNKDNVHTASMFKLNLKDVASHKIIAMERTFMQEFGLKYGDVVKIEGTYKGVQDGIYQIQDTMNKRFAGQHKVDVLCPNNVKTGGTLPNKPAKIYVLSNPSQDTASFKADMAPSMKESKKLS